MIFGNGRDLIYLLEPKVGNFIISLGRKEKRLKLIHVRDAARAIILVLEKDFIYNCVFNLSHEDQITVNDMIKKCFRKSELKKYHHVVYVTYSIGLIGILMLKIIKVLSGKKPKMNRVRLSYNCKDLLESSQTLHITTGWRPEDKLLVQLTKKAEKLET